MMILPTDLAAFSEEHWVLRELDSGLDHCSKCGGAGCAVGFARPDGMPPEQVG